MKLQTKPVFALILAILVPIPLVCCFTQDFPSFEKHSINDYKDSQIEFTTIANKETGILNPVTIEHTGTTASFTSYTTVRTDVTSFPSAAVHLPAGATGNFYSSVCEGGYFLVGSGGSVSFGSSAGTFSFWLKWNTYDGNDRIWGQDGNFEIRFSSNRLVLDWGTDSSLTGMKATWSTGRWYFIAITWNQATDSLALYWGDEDEEPMLDASSTSWSFSSAFPLTQNSIMTSRGTSGQTSWRVDGNLDEFRYYSIQRDLDDLLSDYRKTITGSEEGLEHYYKFENNLADSAGDISLIAISSTSFSQDVPSGIDGWRAEQISIDIRELSVLSVLNGSFQNGVPGTAVDWAGDAIYYPYGWRAKRAAVNPNGYQRVSYSTTNPRYVVIENEGYRVLSPDRYRHYDGTEIYWYQTVDNSEQNTQFEFNMQYLYQRGPIGANYSGNFEFSFQILNGSSILWNWSIDPTSIAQREIWYSVGTMLVDIPEALDSFEVRICLTIDTNSSYVEILETDSDIDDNTANARYLRFLVDDVSLVIAQKPTPQKVDLYINIDPIGTIPILGNSGSGAIQLNNNYWSKSAILFAFSSNSSISFEYSSWINRMLKPPFNSSFSTNLNDIGVAYEIELNQNANLYAFTYIQSYSDATNLGFIVRYAKDWYNPTVEDPFGSNHTSQAIIQSGYLEIPTGVASIVGWWLIRLKSPNYALSISTQVQRNPSAIWNDEAIFRSGDRIRCNAIIGTDYESSFSVNNMKTSWYLPSGVLWSDEIVAISNSSTVLTYGKTLGPGNATVGEWAVSISWINGTEVAFGSTTFELYHRLTVFTQTPRIDIEPGEQFTATISIYDQDNGNPILGGATVRGNWSALDVQFSPNLAKGWWESDFNSSEVGTGNFLLLVIVNMPYYYEANCSIQVNIPVPESLIIITIRATLVGALTVFAAFVVITIMRRFYVITTTRRNLELLALRGRLEDARNLIGVLVIHRSIGLPIYSRIIKGGFQESLLSSFITALSQFRAEFSWDEPRWTAIPITEVITAVQTDSLICAMITVEPASSRQKIQLETFGRNIGALYDMDVDAMKQLINTRSLDDSINPIFDEHFDGGLLRRYSGITDDCPEHLSLVSDAITSMNLDDGATPESIVKAITLLGHSDRKSHRSVLEAIDGDYLIPVNEVVSNSES